MRRLLSKRLRIRPSKRSSLAYVSSRSEIRKFDAQVLPVDGARELDGERALAVLVGVVEEVLLELVEDDEELGAPELVRLQRPLGGELPGLVVEPADPVGQPLVEPPVPRRRARCPLAQELADRRLDAVDEVGDGIVAPLVEDGDDRFREAPVGEVSLGTFAEVALKPRAQERALADAARPVEKGQAGRREVRRDDPPLLLTSEEEGSITLGEGSQADVGRLGNGDRRGCDLLDRVGHGPLSIRSAARRTRWASSATYVSSGISSTSTFRVFQSSCSTSLGCFWIAHDL